MEGIPSAVQTYALQQQLDARATTLQHRLAAVVPHSEGHGREMQEGVAEFASLLVLQMLQAMRRTIPQSGLLDKGFAHDVYVSFFDQEVARQVARRGDFGLTSLLMRQFGERQTSLPPPGQRADALQAYRQQIPPPVDSFLLPTDGFLTSPFGWRRDPIEHGPQWHNGVDIAAPTGALVRAAASGTVRFSGAQQGYGNLVILEHQNGYQTYYGHNAENLVADGAHVRQGQPIARVGQTGRATGPHVHFELRKDGQALDPARFLGVGAPRQNNVKFPPVSTDTDG